MMATLLAAFFMPMKSAKWMTFLDLFWSVAVFALALIGLWTLLRVGT